MVELYKIHLRIGRSVSTGKYEITRLGTRKSATKYETVYQTDLGELTPEEWREGLSRAIEEDKEADVLDVIIEHCTKHCAWLHGKEEIKDYAMNILASRAFLCGNEAWKDVADKVKDKYITFTF